MNSFAAFALLVAAPILAAPVLAAPVPAAPVMAAPALAQTAAAPGSTPHAPSSAPPGVSMQDPPSSGKCRIKGSHTTTIRLTVTPNGEAVDEFIDVSSGDKCLDRQALKTVAGYHFNPAIRNGQRTESHIRLQVNYKSN